MTIFDKDLQKRYPGRKPWQLRGMVTDMLYGLLVVAVMSCAFWAIYAAAVWRGF